MNTFWFYAQFGFEHILDVGGFDHMLFLLVLCAGYPLAQWRRVLVLVTAFTLGHSLTLGLGAAGVKLLSSDVVEFLIPLTIFLTAIETFLSRNAAEPGRPALMRRYVLAGVFGLIHGMGFSSQFTEMETEKNLLITWLPFNLGIELGQLLFVALIVLIGWDMQRIGGLRLSYWTSRLAVLAGLLSVWMMWERWP
ncbi:MAG: HupE/UreJ family protein [Bacteroidia bacterium]|nr:HupE/UreJ family protein [Bacteroidia bacterium]